MHWQNNTRKTPTILWKPEVPKKEPKKIKPPPNGGKTTGPMKLLPTKNPKYPWIFVDDDNIGKIFPYDDLSLTHCRYYKGKLLPCNEVGNC
jgi:hypothetical protein